MASVVFSGQSSDTTVKSRSLDSLVSTVVAVGSSKTRNFYSRSAGSGQTSCVEVYYMGHGSAVCAEAQRQAVCAVFVLYLCLKFYIATKTAWIFKL